MFLRLLRQIPGLPRPSVSLGSEEQALIDELRSVQDRLTRSVDLANLHEDPLRFPLRAISDLAELQVTTHIKAIHLLRQLARVADQVNRPSEAFRTQIEKSFQRVSIGQWFRFSVMVGVLLAVTVSIVGAIVAGAVIESHRNTPDAEALLTASGKFPAAWAAMIRQNDLPFMVTMCAKSQNVGALANGMHYCSVALIMDGVQANLPALPAWGKDIKKWCAAMSVEKRQIDAAHGIDKIFNDCRLLNPKQLSSTSAISEASDSDGCEPDSSSSHPGLLALARILGRHAARAEMRRVRRGAVPLMALVDWLLMTAASLVGALFWSIIAALR